MKFLNLVSVQTQFDRIRPVIFPSQTSLTGTLAAKVLSKEVSPWQKDLQGTCLKGERVAVYRDSLCLFPGSRFMFLNASL